MRLVAFFLLLGFGMLGASSITGTTEWGWGAAGLAVAALAVLIADWRRKWAAMMAPELDSGDGPEVSGARSPAALPARESSPDGAAGRDDDADPPQEGSRAVQPALTGSIADADPGDVGDGAAAPGLEVAPGVAGQEEGVPPAAEQAGGSPTADRELGEVTAAREPASRPGRPDDDRTEDGPAVGGSAVVETGTRSEGANWFTPNSSGEEVAVGPPGVQSRSPLEWEQAGEGASDATVVFSRVRADGVPATGSGSDARGVAPSLRGSGGAQPADQGVSTAMMGDEVLVVDELPRYHRAGCRALDGRATIPLTEGDARELGFTSCAVCAPTRARPGFGPDMEQVRSEDGRIRSRA